jgi:tripartite-type tricarboxylate transporter receptor subunit TctC
VLKRILVAVAFLAVASSAAAQYPNRAIKLVVPFAAGGSTDLIARVVADQLRKELGQPVIVENRGGAAGALGTEEVAKSTPDGYTLAVATVSTMIVYLASHDKPNYTLESFAPITNMASMANVMTAGPSIPAKDLKEFIALAKANPGKYTYATSGVGSINHMLGESFQSYAGVKLIHVPYKGSGPAIQDVMGGQVDLLFDQFPSSKNYIDSGKLKGIGAISPQKIPGYPSIMTMEDVGMKGFNDEAWYGILAPASTPPEVVAKLTDAARKALASPELRARIEQLGARPVGNTPAEFTAQIKVEIERMRKLIKERNIKLDE